MGPPTPPKLAVAADLVDDKKVTGTLDHQWRIRNENTAYQTPAVLTETDSGWRVRWQPSVMHRQLRDGQSFSYSDDRAYRTPVLDTNGRPLMTWQAVTLIDLARAQLTSAGQLARALRPVEPSMTAAGIRKLFDGNNSPRQTVIRLRESDLKRVQRGGIEAIPPGVTTSEQGGALLSATKALHSPPRCRDSRRSGVPRSTPRPAGPSRSSTATAHQRISWTPRSPAPRLRSAPR